MKKKGGWNYRVVHVIGTHPTTLEKYDDYGVYEVYYNKKTGKPDSMTVDPVSPCGETIEEFNNSWNLYFAAMLKPVLVWSDDTDSFEGEEPPLYTNTGVLWDNGTTSSATTATAGNTLWLTARR